MSKSNAYKYGVDQSNYIHRAREMLLRDEAQSLFYAAYELRCYVEIRQEQYLNAQRKYVRSIPRHHKIGAQGRALRDIMSEQRIQSIKWSVAGGKHLDMYYVPVRDELRKNAEKLGELLHAQKHYRGAEDRWWQEKRSFLLDTFELAWTCSKGNMLSPALFSNGQALGTVSFTATFPVENIPTIHAGQKGLMHVDYLEQAPEEWFKDDDLIGRC
ncbi:MAG: hypothetical protein ACMZ66_14475 [Thalassospira sp.]|uniref:hypothetical protein n=1 Tax=Thalassospira sp. TaxID=1912094 RepID=UPI003A8955DF